MSSRTRVFLYVNLLFIVLFLIMPFAIGQQLPATGADTSGGFGAGGPSDIANNFYNGTQVWINALKTPARELFWALAGIDLTWTCITLVLQHQELYPWMGGFIRKLLTIGFFATLLENGTDWIAAIVNFFINLGATAGGRSVTNLSASGIMVSGIQLAGHMLHSAAGAAVTTAVTNPISLLISGPSSLGTVLVLILGALLMVLAYVVIALHFVLAMVEAYVTVGAGYIFLGFGGSRWTVPYTEKYLGMVVSAGVRIMVLELMIGLGSSLYTEWDQMAQKIAAIPDIMDGGTGTGQWSGVQLEFALISSILIYAMLCWTIPKIASNVVAGGLSMSGSDAIGATAAAVGAGVAGGAMVSGSSSNSNSGNAVADVAKAAAMTGAQTGVQLGAAAMTGGSSMAVTAASGAGGVGAVSGVGGAASGMGSAVGAVDGFTPPPPTMGTPDVPVGPSGDGGQGSTPSQGQGTGSAMDTVKSAVNEAEQLLNKLPDSGGHIGGTTPRVDHGE